MSNTTQEVNVKHTENEIPREKTNNTSEVFILFFPSKSFLENIFGCSRSDNNAILGYLCWANKNAFRFLERMSAKHRRAHLRHRVMPLCCYGK